MFARHPAITALLREFGTAADRPVDPASAVERYEAHRASLLAAARAARADLRALLDGPPQPVLGAAPGWVGAKLLAVDSLLRAGGDETATFTRLAASPAEPLPVRLRAAQAIYELAGDDGLAALAALLVEAFADHADLRPVVAGFNGLRGELVRPILGHLYARDRAKRQQARRLLVAIGPPAAAALAEIVQHSEDAFARSDAEEALAMVDPTALDVAHGARAEAAAAAPKRTEVRITLSGLQRPAEWGSSEM
ncbi:MAG: hypothetical protein IT204_15675 [Fimbriimonadaceae bacterium]|nr:hypothetical protein [Fimbriimonadaceae bacterium]